MNILFWNLNKKPQNRIIQQLIRTRHIDIALFAESKADDIESLANQLPKFGFIDTTGCNKIKAICKKQFHCTVRRTQDRYVIISLAGKEESLLITGLHLTAQQDVKGKREFDARHIVSDVVEAESDTGIDKSMVIGDFNASPFDDVLIEPDCFNAVLYKNLIQKREFITWNKTNFKRFYNPVLDFISERTMMYGSLYQNKYPPYWHCLDQVIIRKALLPFFKKMEYVKRVADSSLLTNYGIIEKRFGDHLPLLVKLTATNML